MLVAAILAIAAFPFVASNLPLTVTSNLSKLHSDKQQLRDFKFFMQLAEQLLFITSFEKNLGKFVQQSESLVPFGGFAHPGMFGGKPIGGPLGPDP